MHKINLVVDESFDPRSGLYLKCKVNQVLEVRPSGFADKPEIPFLSRDLISALAKRGIIAGNEYPIDDTHGVFRENIEQGGYDWTRNVPSLQLYLFSPDPSEQKKIVEDNPDLKLGNGGHLFPYTVKGWKEIYLETSITVDDKNRKPRLGIKTDLFFTHPINVGNRSYYNNLKIILGKLRTRLFGIENVVEMSSWSPGSEISMERVSLLPGNYSDQDWAMRSFLTNFNRLLGMDEMKSAIRAEEARTWMRAHLDSMRQNYSEGISPDLVKAGETYLNKCLNLALDSMDSGTMEIFKSTSEQRLEKAASIVQKDEDLCKLLQVIR